MTWDVKAMHWVRDLIAFLFFEPTEDQVRDDRVELEEECRCIPHAPGREVFEKEGR